MSNLIADNIILNMRDSKNLVPDFLIDEAVDYISSLNAGFPFSPEDASCGSETELQTCVKGSRENVDLPRKILNSDFYKNLLLRVERKEVPAGVLKDLNLYLDENRDGVWENSWVYFETSKLSSYAAELLEEDMRKEKSSPESGKRTDMAEFFFIAEGREFLRVPVSYFIKLSLADFYFRKFVSCPEIFRNLSQTLSNFLSDNTSPETLSLYISRSSNSEKMGDSAASETLLRFLLTSLAVRYGNMNFDMKRTGQECDVYFSPHVPMRQKHLSRCIPDNFYRELFMNPCLSGWNDGETKKEYMSLCHMTLSRSYLNTLLKIKDSGMLSGNLIMMPDFSNVSLGNNGIHISIGSGILSREIRKGSVINECHEKAIGDLMIKIIEHFLPLFPGNYTSAPYRTPRKEFRPEKRLGFLPHELDSFHLRNIWKRWKDKVKKNKFGQKAVPGFKNDINTLLENPVKLSGDFLRDHRLVDYPAAFLSSDLYCPLNGVLGNDMEFKNYLHSSGIFDKRMSLYLLIKLREQRNIGFSGFEARFHSLFENFSVDMKFAVELQQFLQMLAYKYISEDKIRHYDILSDPFTESERRYAFFSSAVGVHVLNFRMKGNSILQKKILSNAPGIRKSGRYKGFFKISLTNYMRALINTMEKDGAEIIRLNGFEELMEDLKDRIEHPEKNTSVSKIAREVIRSSGKKKYFNYTASDFNMDVEKYYREILKNRHLNEAVEILAGKMSEYSGRISGNSELAELLTGSKSPDLPVRNVKRKWEKIKDGKADTEDIEYLLTAVSIVEYIERSVK